MNLTLNNFEELVNKTRQIELARITQKLLMSDEVNIVSTHQSTGKILPVFEFVHTEYKLYVRDNFYDLNAIYICREDQSYECANIEYRLIYTPQSKTWYEEEKIKAFNYKLRTDKNLSLKDFEDPSWYNKGWSRSNLIFEGDMIFVDGQGYCFFQGMIHEQNENNFPILPDDAYKTYRHGKNNFCMLYSSWEEMIYKSKIIENHFRKKINQ